MVEQAKFFNVKINVDGKIHNVKVEKGLSFNSFFVEDDGRLAKYNEVPAGDYGTNWQVKCNLEHPEQVKMTKAEFSIFKNMADNKLENGDEMVLSKADIREGEALYRAGMFTKDITKNIPEDYHAGMQDLETGLEEFSYVRSSLYHNKTDEEAAVTFCENGAAPKFRKLMDKSADGTVNITYFAEDLAFNIEEYGYIDKEGKEHSVSPDSDYETITYERDGKSYLERYDENGKLFLRTVTYTQDNKEFREEFENGKTTIYVRYKDSQCADVRETRDKNNKLMLKEYGKTKEIYENGIISKKIVNNGIEEYTYEKGKLVSAKICKGNDFIFDGDGNLTSISYYTKYHDDTFNIKSQTNPKLSAKAQKYRNEFLLMTPKQIAEKIKSQIDGPSFNSKTLAMVDAIPADKFVEVLKEYQKTGGVWFGNKATLFTDIMNEWNMDCWDIRPRLRYAFASYISDKKQSEITSEDSEIVQYLMWNYESDKFKDFVKKFEAYITK